MQQVPLSVLHATGLGNFPQVQEAPGPTALLAFTGFLAHMLRSEAEGIWHWGQRVGPHLVDMAQGRYFKPHLSWGCHPHAVTAPAHVALTVDRHMAPRGLMGAPRLRGALWESWPCLLQLLPTPFTPRPVPFQLSERLDGGTLGTSPTPGVMHRKLCISQPVARGLKGAKFSVVRVGRGLEQQEASGG